ncbi:YARHG domain-containing protein [Faecalimonas sp.]
MIKEKKNKKTRAIELLLVVSICILLVTESVLLMNKNQSRKEEKPILTQEEAKKIDRKNMESAKNTVLEKKGEDIVIGTKEVEKEQEQEQTRDYIIADSHTRLLTGDELATLTAEELQIANNEIFARHGRKFEDEKMKIYFESKSWYHGTIEPQEFDAQYETILNDVEKGNIQLIKSILSMSVESETTEKEE